MAVLPFCALRSWGSERDRPLGDSDSSPKRLPYLLSCSTAIFYLFTLHKKRLFISFFAAKMEQEIKVEKVCIVIRAGKKLAENHN